ncbi:nucleotide-binding universal stress UspA family protein [Frigoribacterium sp. PhB160]|uniref:universal stress protein n=1 Tax=Frigoribacterium sp. PhB160 TaxID=2485192 RepID=UPI000F495503|nr:universal stress protein [Frigoribacterium sp. PhB160]ROS61209.1 nucleotide-binding universal stress UspA family protein [Frigoribacterium sp. PhB160]
MTTDTIVVGAHARTAGVVLSTAARIAARLSARLVVVWVDDSRVPADPVDGSGRGATAPLDPDEYDAVDTSAVETAAARLRTEVQITVDVRVLAGDPAEALARVAADTHAVMIVVGSSNGPAAGLKAALHGSTASFLMHHQLVPVLVVPVSEARP